MARILVDQSIALGDRRVTESGHRLSRYSGEAVADDALVEYALEQGYDVLVLSGDEHFVSDEALSRASNAGLTVAVSHEPHPLRAADRVVEHADDLIKAPSGSVLQLLSHRPRPVRSLGNRETWQGRE